MKKGVVLKYTSPAMAVEQAKEEIRIERIGEQLGLKTNFNSLNIAMSKYFRFAMVNLWAGLSGHGKSYLLNLINKAFLDYKTTQSLNGEIKFVPVIFQFCFEMSAANEILRSVSNDLGVNYNYLLSSQYDKESKEYNTLSQDEVDRIYKALDYYKLQSIFFFETSTNLNNIYATIAYYRSKYDELSKQNGVEYKFVVNIDHTLLIEKLDEKDTMELMANTGRIAIFLKRIGCMVNLLGQLNNNIEDTKRLLTPALQYPMKSDIYAQGQLFNACDNVFTINQPQLLHIKEYGPSKVPTANLMHLLKLKARHGSVGSIWLKNDLYKGQVNETDINTLKGKNPEIINTDEDENVDFNKI